MCHRERSLQGALLLGAILPGSFYLENTKASCRKSLYPEKISKWNKYAVFSMLAGQHSCHFESSGPGPRIFLSKLNLFNRHLLWAGK